MAELQTRVLKALSLFPMGMAPADEIAHRCGYRPARKGRLAVTRVLRLMLSPLSDSGQFVVRQPPQDRWGRAWWSITNAGRAKIAGS